MNAFDLVIRCGAIVYGAEQPPYTTNIGTRGDRIAAIAQYKEHDATGLLVTTGFVDVLTHFDGQASQALPGHLVRRSNKLVTA